MVRRKLIRAQAEELLDRVAVREAPVPVERVAKFLGAEVMHIPSDDDGLSGFLLRDRKGKRLVIGVNKGHHRHRRRFTIGHEIGHLLLHRGEGVHVDQVGSIFRINLRDEDSAQGVDLDEREANLFAAELLMPRAFVRKAVQHFQLLDEFAVQRMARKFDVSSQAMTFRLVNLGYSWV